MGQGDAANGARECAASGGNVAGDLISLAHHLGFLGVCPEVAAFAIAGYAAGLGWRPSAPGNGADEPPAGPTRPATSSSTDATTASASGLSPAAEMFAPVGTTSRRRCSPRGSGSARRRAARRAADPALLARAAAFAQLPATGSVAPEVPTSEAVATCANSATMIDDSADSAMGGAGASSVISAAGAGQPVQQQQSAVGEPRDSAPALSGHADEVGARARAAAAGAAGAPAASKLDEAASGAEAEAAQLEAADACRDGHSASLYVVLRAFFLTAARALRHLAASGADSAGRARAVVVVLTRASGRLRVPASPAQHRAVSDAFRALMPRVFVDGKLVFDVDAVLDFTDAVAPAIGTA